MRLLRAGYSYRQIADALGLSEHIVNTHVEHAYRKLGVNRLR